MLGNDNARVEEGLREPDLVPSEQKSRGWATTPVHCNSKLVNGGEKLPVREPQLTSLLGSPSAETEGGSSATVGVSRRSCVTNAELDKSQTLRDSQ